MNCILSDSSSILFTVYNCSEINFDSESSKCYDCDPDSLVLGGQCLGMKDADSEMKSLKNESL